MNTTTTTTTTTVTTPTLTTTTVINPDRFVHTSLEVEEYLETAKGSRGQP